jgi:hypothetical protein
MSRIRFVVIILCLLAVSPAHARQPLPFNLSYWFNTVLSDTRNALGMPWLRAPEGLKLSADFAAGYQCMALNFNAPIPVTTPFAPPFDVSSPIDLKLEDANLWVGEAVVDLQYDNSWFIELKGSGTAVRNIEVTTRKNPALPFFTSEIEPIEWTGSRLEWWNIEGNVGYRTAYDFSLFAGLKRDRLSLALNDPRVGGEAVNVFVPLAPGVYFIQEDGGDFILKSWLPYLGVSLYSPSFMASFKWSPYAWGDLNLPIRENLVFVAGGVLAESIEYDYQVLDPGAMIEAEMEYFPKLPYNCDVSFWMKGQWYRIRSDGELFFKYIRNDAGTITDISDQASGTSVLSRSIYSGGIRAGFSF